MILLEINFNLGRCIVWTKQYIRESGFLKINVHINYPDDMEALEKKAADLLSSILIKKLQPKEIDKLVEILKDDSNKIAW